MAFAHAPLSASELGPAAAKLVGPAAPAPMRGMAARGLAPLPPRDLLVALYQVWVSNDPDLGEVAAKTVESLPSGVVIGALGEVHLPAGVLDFLSRRLAGKDGAIEKIVGHPNVHDETLAGVARVCSAGVCDILAANQRRWLAFPVIVESLYQNPNCRMSVTHNMLELAIRQGVDLNLPNMEEIRQALGEGAAPEPTRDAVFAAAAASGTVAADQAKMREQLRRAGPAEELDFDARGDLGDLDGLLDHGPEDDMSLPLASDAVSEGESEVEVEAEERALSADDRGVMLSKLRPMEKMRLALLGTAAERAILIRDSNKSVAMSAIKSPKVRVDEAIGYVKSRTMHLEVIRYASRRGDWVKHYEIKLNLVLNPKCPMSIAMSLLSRLHMHDVRKVARSRNIPNALSMAAKRRMEQRR